MSLKFTLRVHARPLAGQEALSQPAEGIGGESLDEPDAGGSGPETQPETPPEPDAEVADLVRLASEPLDLEPEAKRDSAAVAIRQNLSGGSRISTDLPGGIYVSNGPAGVTFTLPPWNAPESS